jgi:hypothetical protein
MRASVAALIGAAFLLATTAIAASPQVYAVVDATNHVVNTVEWDGVTQWSAPAGTMAIPANGAAVSIGWTWDGFQFNPPAK